MVVSSNKDLSLAKILSRLKSKSGASLYGTQGHFLWCTKVLGLELETVPILGEMTITKDLLLHFQQAPKEDGEGVVIEFEDGTHYKAKSMDYYSSI